MSAWTATPAAADWRRFGSRRFRWYHLLALSQGIVAVLTGFDVIIPLALAMGCPPAVTPLLGMLPLAGGMAPLLLPRLLERSDGNLRRLTAVLSALGETRGLVLAGLVVLLVSGSLPAPAVLVLLVAVVGMGGVLSSMVGANLLSWHSAVLAEPDRRLVVPRLMSISLAVGALLLLPSALLLDALVARFGLIVYAVPFAVAGLFGVLEVVVQRRLPRPGRVRVPRSAPAGEQPASPALVQFVRVSLVNALGMGLTPYFSVYAIAVLGLTPGFTMVVGAIGLLTQVVASTVAGARLTRGSSAAMLRFSFAARAGAMACAALALPGLVFAPLLLIVAAVLGAIGFTSGSLAANERLFRLINGPAVLRQYGRYTAATSGVMTVGQVVSGVTLAAGAGLGYPIWAALFAASSGLRVLAHRLAAPERLMRTAAVAVPEIAPPALSDPVPEVT